MSRIKVDLKTGKVISVVDCEDDRMTQEEANTKFSHLLAEMIRDQVILERGLESDENQKLVC